MRDGSRRARASATPKPAARLSARTLTDLAVRHTAKRADARECSTGEQKALLISIVLADARELARARDGMRRSCCWTRSPPIWTHVRRAALFEEIHASAPRPG